MSAGTVADMLVEMPSNPGGAGGPSAPRPHSPIAALRHELRVSEALHHYRPRSCDALPRFTTEIDALSEVRPWSDH